MGEHSCIGSSVEPGTGHWEEYAEISGHCWVSFVEQVALIVWRMGKFGESKGKAKVSLFTVVEIFWLL